MSRAGELGGLRDTPLAPPLSTVGAVSVLTHGRPAQTTAALEMLMEAGAAAGVSLHFDGEETAKHGLRAREGVLLDAPAAPEAGSVDLCVVLGGDGTILRALRLYAGTRVPVFAVNFGDIGFLATIEPDELADGLRRAFEGDFELLRLPAIVVNSVPPPPPPPPPP
ncbi:MAG TPA: NAD(+)/NADH kinase, partial [Solirubrobacteraceae bacterium]|nr:NAD(+)/NADH kinase [Solirubrobacteraceae bacterium]